MTESLTNKCRAALPLLTDIFFGIWLFAETAFEHSMVSRIAMALFLLSALLMIWSAGRIHISYWMGFSLLLIAWCAVVSGCFAVHREESWDKVGTLLVNLVFLFFLYQYGILRGNFKSICNAYLLAVCAIAVYVIYRCWPLNFMESRLGVITDPARYAVVLNPNWIGLLAAFGFAMVLQRVLNEKTPWHWIAVGLFCGAVVLMTKSIKAYGATFLLTLTLVLIRWPKKWGWKLLALVVGSAIFYRFVLNRFETFDKMFFYNVRCTLENILYPDINNAVSLESRLGMAGVGLKAFMERPWTGFGLDGFRFLPGSQDTYSHNNYIELLVCGGIPMLVIYYVPQLIAVVRGWKLARRGNAVLRLLVPVAIVQIIMDYAMVSYVDRTALMWPVLLMAFTRAAEGRENDGKQLFSVLSNPCVLVRYCSTHGKLKWMPDKLYLRLLYRGCMGKKLHLNPPLTMTEKQQWMKLYDHNPLYCTLVDKAAVREYVEKIAGPDVLIPCLGVWERGEDIPFEELPHKFVLKCTHDSGSVRICRDKSAFDGKEAAAWLTKKLQKSYYFSGREWPYKFVRPRILCEAFIGETDGTQPNDYKFFCFDGKVRAILVCTNRTEHHADYFFFDREFRRFPVNDVTAATPEDFSMPRPAHFAEMIQLAEKLSGDLPFVRVDLYEAQGKVYFGELTLFDQSGFAGDYVGDGDRKMGEFLHLREKRI